ncbi:MAG: lysoplasmalogenase [Flavobacteriaceae bacterium]|nr:lysoplasmalogenase [Flavobacteriaceae bacterium]
MQSKLHTSFSVVYFIVVIDTIICSSIEKLMPMYYFTKPAILTLLVIYFWLQSTHLNKRTRYITVLALLFSLIGDVLLMFVDKSSNFFIGGLIAFLLAHLMYISVFLKSRNKNANPFSIIVVLLIYASGLFYLIKDGLGEMLIPVLLYLIVILTMAITAFLRKRLASSNSYNLVFAGAIFFMISDSLLALNKFYETLPLSNISIMLTYALAQYLIVSGILKQEH